MWRSKILGALPIPLLLVIGCTTEPEPDPESITKDDIINNSGTDYCGMFDLHFGCDMCDFLGFYDDGECDAFCPFPGGDGRDPDCPVCSSDGECNSDCAEGEDPDCELDCSEDGDCNSDCAEGEDPDCEPDCSEDGDCNSDCAEGEDPDCELDCSADGECNSDCEEGADPDCEPGCSADGECNRECDDDPDCDPLCTGECGDCDEICNGLDDNCNELIDEGLWCRFASGRDDALYGVWGASRETIYFVGPSDVVLTLDEERIVEEAIVDGAGAIHDIWGFAEEFETQDGPLLSMEIWGVGETTIRRADDRWIGLVEEFCGISGWGPIQLPAAEYPEHLFALPCEAGSIADRHMGEDWQTIPSSTDAVLRSIYEGTAVGDGGAMVQFDGTSWSSLESPTDHDLYGNDAYWAVGEGGTVVRDTELVESGTGETLRGVTSFSSGEGELESWAVGEGGVILHWEEERGSWEAQPSETTVTLRAVFALSEDDLWAVGDEGMILNLRR